MPSTPVNGESLKGKWLFQSCSPEDSVGVRKKLFELEGGGDEENQWSSSEYFSQSINDASCLSGTSHTNLFDENSPTLPQVSLKGRG